jgi:hypothetical protein
LTSKATCVLIRWWLQPVDTARQALICFLAHRSRVLESPHFDLNKRPSMLQQNSKTIFSK